MTDRIVFLAPLHGLKSDGRMSGRGFEFENDLFISSDSGYYEELISRHFRDSSDARFHVYRQELLLEGLASQPFLHATWSLGDDANVERRADELLATWGYLSQALWLVKDNSVNFHRCVGSATVGSGRVIPWRSTLISWFFDSAGAQQPTLFSLEELRQARAYLRQVSEIALYLASATADRGGVLLVKKGHRLIRSQFFLISARCHNILPLRIAQYVVCLEALVLSNQAELNHRLGERIALLLAESGDEQERIYDKVRLAYSVRSAVVHGDSVKLDLIRLSDVSRDCDDIIRRMFKRILGDPELIKLFDEKITTSDDLERYFKTLLFRVRP